MNVQLPIDDGYLSSPATTPGSSIDEGTGYLVVKRHFKNKWYSPRNVPVAIVSVSVLQVLFHLYATVELNKWLRFEPSKRWELWRYLTYMVVHDDWSHLVLNTSIQCLFAAFLEIHQGRFRVLVIYILGGITGVLGAACLHPDLVVGASAGGYALLLSNFADLILNYETMGYKVYRTISVVTLVLFDIGYDIVHVFSRKEPQVSWQAHFCGGLTGLLLGLVVFKCHRPTTTRKTCFYVGFIFYLVFVIFVVCLTVQIGRCTPPSSIRYRYVYLC